MLLVGAGLVALALPIAAAALTRLPGDGVLRALRTDDPVTPADLERLADSRQAAWRWRTDPRDRAEFALARLLQAERAAPTHDGADGDKLRAAEAALTIALGTAPGDPYGWTRLALVRWRLGRPAPRVEAALAAARTTGPRVRRLRPLRRALAARLTAAPDG